MTDSRYKRLGNRYRRWIVVGAGSIILMLFAFVLAFSLGGTNGNDNIVIAGNPTIIFSWQPANKQAVVVSIPSDVIIDGVHGYGQYSLQSLWELGRIDKKDGMVLAQSLEDALAIPLPYYIGGDMRSQSQITPPGRVSDVFSLGNVLGFMRGSVRTNMSLVDFLRVSWSLVFLRSDRFITREIGARELSSQVLPDGTTRQVLNSDAVGSLLGDMFEDHAIRAEGMRIAVYNTTKTPGLAEHVAGLLGRIGAVVVRTGNADTPVDRCQVRGEKSKFSTETARTIIRLYDCALITDSRDDQADLGIYMGSTFAKRYLPQ